VGEDRKQVNTSYGVIIIGGGPAGLTAGLYCARSGFKSLLIEKGVMGGQITYADRVENYPGFPQGISGLELGQLMHKQAVRWELQTLLAEVTRLVPHISQPIKGVRRGDSFHRHLVSTSEGDFITDSVIIASGSQFRKLMVPGEDEFTGKGVSYCATCDGPLFRDKAVVVVGGGDSALSEAIYLSRFASSVKVIHRRNQLRAGRALSQTAEMDPKIDFVWDSVVTRIEGDRVVNQLRLRNTKDDTISVLPAAGVFIAVGSQPDTDYVQGIIPLDKDGYIITNEVMETEVAGILAAGDVRHNSARQVICAAGDGATAAISVERFLSSS